MALVVLSRGHHGTGGTPPATADGFIEDVLVREYLGATEDRLRELGHQVVVLSGWPYRARHARTRDLRADVYVCAHTNATGRWGGVFYDARTTPGRGDALARHVADALDVACPELGQVHVYPSRQGDWTSRPLSVISGATPPAIVYEPFHIDQPLHAQLREPEGLRRVGLALAEGLHAWLGAR